MVVADYLCRIAYCRVIAHFKDCIAMYEYRNSLRDADIGADFPHSAIADSNTPWGCTDVTCAVAPNAKFGFIW